MQVVLVVFVVSLCIQLVYFSLIEWGFSRYKIPTTSAKPSISVIVVGRNEAANLSKLIPDLKKQDYPDYEIILVDNSSTDDSEAIINLYSRDNIHGIQAGEAPEGVNNKKWALEAGISKAKNDYLIFTDADVNIPSDQWLSTLAKGFSENREVVLGISPYERYSGLLNLFIRYETLFTAFQYVGFALLRSPYMGVGRNLGYKKDRFLQGDGFESIRAVTGGDDDLLVNKMARKDNVGVVLGVDSHVYSYPKTSLKSFLSQKIRHLSVGKHYKSKDKLILGLFLVSLCLSVIVGGFLVVIGWEPFLVLTALFVRYLFFGLAFHKALEKMEIRFEVQYLMFLDILYPVYYISTAIGTFWAKKIQWT